MSIQENITKVKIALENVKAHCMCLKLEDDGARFTVIYPNGDFQVHGTRVSYRENGKLWALNKLLEKMEQHWIESYPA